VAFIIVRPDGSALSTIEGAVIVFETEKSAGPWLQPGERIEPAPAGIEGAEPMEGETRRGDDT
jgi:hypothetical protein